MVMTVASILKITGKIYKTVKPGETMRHVQRTFHIQGSEAELDPLAQKLLGANLDVIKTAFQE